MNALLTLAPRQIGGDTIQTVNARDLHAFLEVQTAFKDWISRRIADYEFSEGRDFCSFLSESSRGRPAKEYAITLDMAKELAMVERNEKGKQARQYFIECERRLKGASIPDLSDPVVLVQLLTEHASKRIEAEQRAAEAEALANTMRDDVAAHERLTKAEGSLCVTDAAKALHVARKDLITWLVQQQWCYRRNGTANLLGYQRHTVNGDLEHKVTTVLRPDGSEKITEQVRVTAQGLAKLAKLMPERLRAA